MPNNSENFRIPEFIMNEYKPLTAKEEIELSQRIKAGGEAEEKLSALLHQKPGNHNIFRDTLLLNFLQDQYKNDPEYIDLIKTIQDGNAAFDRLVLSSVPRVKKIAARTTRMNKEGTNSFDDYFQTAFKVICICARNYDGNTGTRFGSYVYPGLIREMLKENAKTRYSVQIPDDSLPKLSKLRRLMETQSLTSAAKKLGIKVTDAERLVIAAEYPWSMEEIIRNGTDEFDFSETLPDPAAVSAKDIDFDIVWNEVLAELRKAVSKLSDDDKFIIMHRYGFGVSPKRLRDFVGITAKTTGGAQKQQLKAENNLANQIGREKLNRWKRELFG